MAPPHTRKRKSSAPTGETSAIVADAGGSGSAPSSAKKTRRSRKSDATRVISLDGEEILGDDPFSFDKKADSHPEPLKNISVERTPFGGMKFSRSPPTSSDRYASLERRATVSGTPSSSLTRPAGTSGSLGANLKEDMMTSFNKSRSTTPRSTKKNTASQPADETFKLEEEDSDKVTSDKKASTQATESASGKRKSRASEFNEKAASIYEDKKKKNDLYKVPDLSAAEQLEVDHAFEEHQLLSAGARVLALWDRDYYPAYVCGREGLGRYYVHFVEDNINRLLPPSGVFPLAALSAGQEVTFLKMNDNEEVSRVAEIVNMPSNEDADAWAEGLLELRENESEEPDEIKKVSWQKVMLFKDQHAKIGKPINKPVNLVDRENIVNESRSSRRSRASRISTEDLTTSIVATPQPSTRVSRASRTPRVVKPAILSEESTETPEVATPKSTGRRGRPSKMNVSAETPKSLAKNTPQRLMQQIDEVDDEEAKAENGDKEKDAVEETEEEEEKQAESSKTEGTKLDVSVEEQSPPTDQSPAEEKAGEVVGSEIEGDKSMTTQEVPEIINGAQQDLSSSNDDKVNGTTVSVKQDEEPVTGSQADQSVASQNGAQQKAVTKDDSVPTNGNNESNADSGNVDNTEEPKVSSQPTFIFRNMKFVLTSATRSKKNSDFTKRDYRTKIEERGGEIIDDFSALQEGAKAFLIADTYYRTHKYLSALSLSVPCVKHNWIQDCVNKETLLDHTLYMLPAGESTLEVGTTYNWKPLKGSLLQGKRVWVYSRSEPSKADERTLGFVDIWSSIIGNLGATLVKDVPNGLPEKLVYCRTNPVDILLSDTTCEEPLAEAVEADGGQAVSSEWVIQAIVTGELPEVSTCERFRFNSTG